MSKYGITTFVQITKEVYDAKIYEKSKSVV